MQFPGEHYKLFAYVISSSIVHGSLNFNSSFNGQYLHVPSLRLPMIAQKTPMHTPVIKMAGKPKIHFIQGTPRCEADLIKR